MKLILQSVLLIISIAVLIFLCIGIYVFYSASSNKIIIDINQKTIRREQGEILSFYITGPEGYVTFQLKDKAKGTLFYLLKTNNNYIADKVFNQHNNICCGDSDLFIFKPVPGNRYTITQKSNRNSKPYSINVVFDSLNNVKIMEDK